MRVKEDSIEQNLHRRGGILEGDEMRCVDCNVHFKSSQNLFYECLDFSQIWFLCANDLALQQRFKMKLCLISFNQFGGLAVG